ncbi:MAG: DUF1178 family protein [Hyphomicrobiales bacterium]
MIRFSLKCDASHDFDGWFRSGDDFQTQKKRGLLACPSCGSTEVEKALMTPSVPKKGNQVPTAVPIELEAPSAPPPVAATAAAAPTPAPVPIAQAPENPLTKMPPELREKVIGAMKEWRDTIVSKSEHVGPRFAEEARKIHFQEAEERPIYGEASPEEVQELLEDGVECAPLPILPEDHN